MMLGMGGTAKLLRQRRANVLCVLNLTHESNIVQFLLYQGVNFLMAIESGHVSSLN
jgi:hypothetical protein